MKSVVNYNDIFSHMLYLLGRREWQQLELSEIRLQNRFKEKCSEL